MHFNVPVLCGTHVGGVIARSPGDTLENSPLLPQLASRTAPAHARVQTSLKRQLSIVWKMQKQELLSGAHQGSWA